ncbi:hypothetical protein L1987_59024 [Smallanthus sonchifolius]|uniref:Uncharacterized protein n=1 Tax=Smallanthus sonchifolius TaxID=185202 RepID=A0ACB9D430_9ASTR|nr:hypothetical protein L1987_59024 [Smallanthus sonchifolius]
MPGPTLPSRFMLLKEGNYMGGRQEFDEEKKVEQQQQDEGLDPKIWDCGSPLYDSYELVSITNVLDRHLMKFPNVIKRSTRSITHPSSYSSVFPVPVISMANHPPRKMSECSFMPSFKLWKMKTNNVGNVKVGILKICHRIVSWRK